MNTDGKPRVAWVYTLSKESLQRELTTRQVPTEGHLASLRQRMVAYVRSHPEEFLDKPEDAPEYNEGNDITNDMEQIESELEQLRNIRHSSMIQENPRPDTAKVLDQMRKWNCHFDGRDLYTFLERIEELQRAYALSDEQILRGFPELLRGDAQL